MRRVDYARRDWQWRHHHDRFVRRVTAQRPRLVCQDCGGEGGYVEPVLDFGIGPWEPCGWCEGTGLVTPWLRGQWLLWRREERRRCLPVTTA